jgi:aldose 1-epimerase
MPFEVTQTKAPGVIGRDPTIYVLEEGGQAGAEVWPAMGFNCLRWYVYRDGGKELLYCAPDVFQDARPTRSGIPVLFPFPNRIRDGRYSFRGTTYQLPLNDSAKKNAIHGFACRFPWRVIGTGADADSAWVTGEFRCSVDAPNCLSLWPADHQIRLTVRLGRGTLRLEAEVHNPDTRPLPWGLGYHPYFQIGDEDCAVEVPAMDYWKLEESLPTGERKPVDAARALNAPRHYKELTLDDVLTTLPARAPRMDGLIERATLQRTDKVCLRMFTSEPFRDLVVFTPPHRHAFCVEPYTCPTDAVNLEELVGETGWAVMPPGGTAKLLVELWV